MEFFIDTADLNGVQGAMNWGALSGATANPSLYARAGEELAGFEQHMVKIYEIRGGLPVFAESTAMTTQEMVERGKRLVGLTPNVVIKLPIGVESLAVTETLAEDGIVVNITLVSSAPQTLLAARAGTRYISLFVERVDDVGSDEVANLEEIVRCIHNYDSGHRCEIIAAPIRSPCHVTAAALMGVDIATVPSRTLKNYVKHPLTAEGLAKSETDWEKVKNTQVSVQVWRQHLEWRDHAPALEEGAAPRHSERVWRLDGWNWYGA